MHNNLYFTFKRKVLQLICKLMYSYKKSQKNFEINTQFLNKIEKELHFTIVITTFNNEKYCIENIKSVLNQNYNNFRIILIDDCSIDKTFENLQKYLENHPLKSKVQLIKNQVRQKKLANLFNAINSLKNGDIVIELDGDDYFINNKVLSVFNYYYQNNDAMIVYANYINYPLQLAKKLNLQTYSNLTPKFIKKNNLYRDYPWVYSGIRSYKAKLFKQIKKEDLCFDNTVNFYPVCHDMAMFYPMLEMADQKIEYIAQPLLIRNIDSPINDFKSYDTNFRVKIMKEIKGKPKYNSCS